MSSQHSATSGTVHLHRVLRAPPARVYRAFLDPAALAKWLPPHGFVGTLHAFDATVGGGYHMSFTNLGTGGSHSFRATFVELEPDARIVHVDTFDSPDLPGEILVAVTLAPNLCGTELRIEQTGIPAAIPTDFCYQGWQESLALLALLVEPEIPDGV